VSRAEKIGLGGTAFGIGVTIGSAVLTFAGVDMSAALLWLMGGLGVAFMVGGAVTAIKGWRARDREPPVDRLREALTRGMALRTVLNSEDRGHWEGEDVVLPEPRPTRDDPLYVWASETHGLLREHFPAYADAFYGDDPSLGSETFALPYIMEIKRGSREAYLERRIAVLRDAAKP
jgi:hypothetical protein